MKHCSDIINLQVNNRQMNKDNCHLWSIKLLIQPSKKLLFRIKQILSILLTQGRRALFGKAYNQ